MTALAHRQPPPSAQEAALARSSGQSLSRLIRKSQPVTLKVTDADHEQPIELPPGAVLLLMDILEAMAAGRGITLIPENAELTTVQAADVLNVSRPFLIKLLEEKALPCRKVGVENQNSGTKFAFSTLANSISTSVPCSTAWCFFDFFLPVNSKLSQPS